MINLKTLSKYRLETMTVCVFQCEFWVGGTIFVKQQLENIRGSSENNNFIECRPLVRMVLVKKG